MILEINKINKIKLTLSNNKLYPYKYKFNLLTINFYIYPYSRFVIID